MYFKKANPETIRKRREEYNELYSEQIEWFETNMKLIRENTFLVDMYTILTTGSRPISEKMLSSINASMSNWRYDPVERTKREDKLKPIIEKISVLKDIVEAVDGNRIHTRFSAHGFVTSLMEQAKTRLSLSEKQMKALNTCWKNIHSNLKRNLKVSKFLLTIKRRINEEIHYFRCFINNHNIKFLHRN